VSEYYLRSMDEEDLTWVNATEKLAYSFPWSKNGFIKSLDEGLCYIFSNINHDPLGYACFTSVLDELHLLNFCIAPKNHRQGLGEKFLMQLMAKFKGTKFAVILLEVRESNLYAIHLYKKLGFIIDGKRPNYYPAALNREDAILMSFKF